MTESSENKKKKAEEQLNLGIIYINNGEVSKAIEHWGNIERNDDKWSYAQAQLKLGCIFEEKDDVEKAIVCWKKINLQDSKEIYTLAQFSLGTALNRKDDIDEAIIYWQNIERKDNKSLYAMAQFNIGTIFERKCNADKAIEYFSNIKKEDSEEVYFEAQFCLGGIFLKKNNICKLSKYWNNIKYKNTNLLHEYIRSEYIKLFKENLHDKYIINIIKYIFYLDQEVINIVNKLMLNTFKKGNFIKNPERKVATYTRSEVVEKIIQSKDDSFHLNISNNMNDTTEGEILFKFIDLNKDDKEKSLYAFLTCFTFTITH